MSRFEFGESVQRRVQELEDKSAKDAKRAELLKHRKAFHSEFIQVIDAYNNGGVEISTAPFLEYPARVALHGLVRTFKYHGIKPKEMSRGYSKGHLGIHPEVHGLGWLATRLRGYKIPDEYKLDTPDPKAGYSRSWRDYAPYPEERMLVTPDLLVMSRKLPALPGKTIFQDDSVKDPGMLWDENSLEKFYRDAFDTITIVDSVIDQVAEQGVRWVDP